MLLVARGFYIDSGEERSYEVGTTYQLKYYVSSALISIDYILSSVEEMMGRFENKVEYFRYHIDGLFNFLGLINDRFFCKAKSMMVYMEKYEPAYAIRISTRNFGMIKGIKSVPLYSVFCI